MGDLSMNHVDVNHAKLEGVTDATVYCIYTCINEIYYVTIIYIIVIIIVIILLLAIIIVICITICIYIYTYIYICIYTLTFLVTFPIGNQAPAT